jgi:hypothetical protein
VKGRLIRNYENVPFGVGDGDSLAWSEGNLDDVRAGNDVGAVSMKGGKGQSVRGVWSS